MKTLYTSLFAFILIVISSFQGHSLHAQSALSNPEPESYFDFWLGKWEVSWEESDGNIGKGTNHIHKILDDTVLLENFEILEGNNRGFKGKSMSVYQPDRNRWKQAWTDNNGGYYDFTGMLDGQNRIFQTDVNRLPDGRRFVQRMVFYNISDSSFVWDWESSNDGGESWNLNWRINYKRIQ